MSTIEVYHHRKRSSCSSNSSWISDSSTTSKTMAFTYIQDPSPRPSQQHIRYGTCPDMRILGRTSPEIHSACHSWTCATTTGNANTSPRSTACSPPNISGMSTTVWKMCGSNLTEQFTSLADDWPTAKASLEDLALSLDGLRFHTPHSKPSENHQSTSLDRQGDMASKVIYPLAKLPHKVQPVKKASLTKPTMHRRLSFDVLPTPHELASCQAMKRIHRRNTTQIIRQGYHTR
ncbi:hypothetical protein MPSEU_000009900 [Mayamaea pseudoterrestris]|nr:hypothetical protein MPSEU_000009900 [Mayamaea pseudoterrestris]